MTQRRVISRRCKPFVREYEVITDKAELIFYQALGLITLEGIMSFFLYVQSDGALYDFNHSRRRLVGSCSSGQGVGRNNPLMQSMPGIGPIPEGQYRCFYRSAHKQALDPFPTNQTFGRGPFTLRTDATGDNDGAIDCAPETLDWVRRSYLRGREHCYLVVVPRWTGA